MKNKTLVVIYSIGLVLLFSSLFFDSKIITSMNSIKNPVLDFGFGAIEHIGSVIIILILMTTLFLWEEKKREWIPTLWLGFALAIVLTIVIKLLIMRERPFDAAFWPFFWIKDYSFPSMHTAIAFSALPVLDKEYPMFKWAWLIIAVFVGLSRVYLGVHYLSDVLFGAMLGFACGSLFVYIEETKKVFRKWKIFSK